MTPRNKDARAQGHEEGSKARGGGVQLTESAGVDVDDKFSWC